MLSYHSPLIVNIIEADYFQERQRDINDVIITNYDVIIAKEKKNEFYVFKIYFKLYIYKIIVYIIKYIYSQN